MYFIAKSYLTLLAAKNADATVIYQRPSIAEAGGRDRDERFCDDILGWRRGVYARRRSDMLSMISLA